MSRSIVCLFSGAIAVLAMNSIAMAKAGHAPPTQNKMLAVQVLLDRAGFSPGEIDGRGGRNTTSAIAAFERAKNIRVDEAVASASEPSLVSYAITPADAEGPFAKIPADMMEKAALPRLSFVSLTEELGERFHTSPALLKRLNPSARFAAGETIQVPNIRQEAPASGGPGLTLTVSKSQAILTVADRAGAVLYHAPVSSGSEHDPLPIGDWTVTGVAKEPPFFYNPELFWDADPGHAKVKLAPGPNNPVGLVWIDISKPHYGIHGTPEPGSIGHSESHGCVRLTNWDAVAVAGLVARGTKVVFIE